VGIFAARRSPADDPGARAEPTDGASGMGLPVNMGSPVGLPARFQAVGEALASGSGSAEACAVVGRDLARDGGSLHEGLEALRATYQLVRGFDPSYDDVLALSQAWSESTLGYLHQISCADPMTGLASLAHLRSHLSDLYRGEGQELGRVRHRFALVIVDLPTDPVGLDEEDRDPWARPLRLSRLGEAARTVFAGAETVAGLGATRVVVLARRDERLGQRAALLRRMVDTLDLHGRPARVWIEGLPPTDAGAANLLDELARP
jgi:hypothetical protein